MRGSVSCRCVLGETRPAGAGPGPRMARARARRHGWPAAATAGRCGWQPKERAAAAALALMAVALATAALLYALAPAGDIPVSARVSHRTSLLKPSPKYKPWEANRAAVIHACTLPRVSGEAALTDWRPGDAPAVLVGASDNSALREATRRQVLLAERGNATVKLASSDTWSTKQVRVPRASVKLGRGAFTHACVHVRGARAGAPQCHVVAARLRPRQNACRTARHDRLAARAPNAT